MQKIEFTETVTIDDATVTAINVYPLNFVSFADLYAKVTADVRNKSPLSANALMQRKRIILQAQFMDGDKRLVPTDAHITQLPIPVAKAIIATLDVGEGVPGKILNDGNGISTPVHYKLGTPIGMVVSGKKTEIAELEFQARVYGDIEDVLAGDGEVAQALELIRKVASPITDGNMTSLPTWAVDRLTVADGVVIMRDILPRFLG